MNTEVGQRLGQVDHIAALAELQPGGNVGQPEDRHTVIAEEYAAAFSIENIGSPEHHGRELADDVPDIDYAIIDQRCPANWLHQLLGRAIPLSPGDAVVLFDHDAWREEQAGVSVGSDAVHTH